MIVLDTNVIAELMKEVPSEKVISFVDKQDASELYVTAVTIAEIGYGLHSLPKGKRRKSLEQAFMKTISEGFSHRVLPFDEDAAIIYGEIMAHRKEKGHPLSMPDGQIAAITLCAQARLATRNIKDFLSCNLALLNPFE